MTEPARAAGRLLQTSLDAETLEQALQTAGRRAFGRR